MNLAERAAKFKECRDLLAALYAHTPEQAAEFKQQKVREMAKAEARRNPSPQMEIPGA